MKLLRLIQALTASASLATFPAFAQISASLLGTETGTGVVGNALNALKQGAVGNTPATGGKVGTFTLSASEGTNQNFAVGTSTNLGINASASSTAEYQVNSNAGLGLAGSSFKQVIGTSGTAENSATRAQALTDYKAQSVATELGSSVTDYVQKAVDMEKSGKTTQQIQQAGYAWWGATNARTTNETDTAYVSRLASKTEVTTDYTQKVEQINQRAQSDFQSATSFSDAANGIIKGSFNASEVSTSDTGAKTETKTVTTTNWAANSVDANGTARDAGSQTVTQNTFSAADAGNSSQKNNTVVVAGIGNTANINAGSGSTFTSNVTARSAITAPTSNSATANGGAGASFSSTSNANASNSSFASVFVQSF